LSIKLTGQQCPVCLEFIRSQRTYSSHASRHFGGVSKEAPLSAYTPALPIEKAIKLAAKLRGGHPTSALGHRELASSLLLKRRIMEKKKKTQWNDPETAMFLLCLLG